MRTFAVFFIILGALLAVSSRLAAQARAQEDAERVCPAPSSPEIKTCHLLRLINYPPSMEVASGARSPQNAPAGFGPADIQAAYNLAASSASAGAGRTIAIVVAQDGPTVEADLAVYRSTFSLPPCTSASGCLRKINQDGATSPLPTADTGWASEMNVNLDMISAVCPNCNIVLVEANSELDADFTTAVNTAALQTHVVAISNPYGGDESSSDKFFCANYDHPGIAVVASAGDEGYGAKSPANCPTVTAVGGTSLVRSSTSARGWTETVWGSPTDSQGGTGSGCSIVIPLPSWQPGVAGCTMRVVNDVAILADPNTGPAIYDQGAWGVYGGTSVSAPLIAAVYGLAPPAEPSDYPVSYAYANPGALFDITQGTNGQCSGSLLCNAGLGYDGPSGLGTPNGVAAFGPVDSLPTVTPAVTGTLGSNGWYTSPVTLSWSITGNPAPATSGCHAGEVPNTAGKTYKCTATNSLGSATESISVKRDSIRPGVTIMTPASGAIYARKSIVLASYACTDTLSGVASCIGTRAVGTTIPTATIGSHNFHVEATDNAGKNFGLTVTYTVQ